MLTDFFAYRYADVKIWSAFTIKEKRLILQTYRIVSDQIAPYYVDGKESPSGKTFWTDLHNKIATELGMKSLSPLAYSYPTTFNGKQTTVSGTWPMISVCENWLLADFQDGLNPDEFVKERIGLLEVAFRKSLESLEENNRHLETVIKGTKQGDISEPAIRLRESLGAGLDWLKKKNSDENEKYRSAVEELNTRLRQSGCGLHYHNGFIQFSKDQKIAVELEAPFWNLISDPKWVNVDTDMKEAVDRRDTGAKDPAFYAARSLESTIKIIAIERGWSTGNEIGVSNYIDKLSSKANDFIERWEADFLKKFFTEIRNPHSHGAGPSLMPELATQQVDWAIEFCMSWIKSLITRI